MAVVVTEPEEPPVMAKRLLYPVNVLHPDTGEQVTLEAGTAVPAWAEPILDLHPGWWEQVDTADLQAELEQRVAAAQAALDTAKELDA